VPLCPLGALGRLGPDARDVHDAFALSKEPTAYAAFWGHDATTLLTMAKEPNRYIMPLAAAKPGRHLRRSEDLWPLAGRLLFAERLRLNTQRVLAVLLSKPVLSSVWWSLSESGVTLAPEGEKALALWMNSTLGLLTWLVHREETEGAWVKFKKATLEGLPVLDGRSVGAGGVLELAAAYDSLCNEVLQPLPAMDTDPVRAAIDTTLERALGLPDCSSLREMLAREPVMCLKRM
jgi:hypothetical protein